MNRMHAWGNLPHERDCGWGEWEPRGALSQSSHHILFFVSCLSAYLIFIHSSSLSILVSLPPLPPPKKRKIYKHYVHQSQPQSQFRNRPFDMTNHLRTIIFLLLSSSSTVVMQIYTIYRIHSSLDTALGSVKGDLIPHQAIRSVCMEMHRFRAPPPQFFYP